MDQIFIFNKKSLFWERTQSIETKTEQRTLSNYIYLYSIKKKKTLSKLNISWVNSCQGYFDAGQKLHSNQSWIWKDWLKQGYITLCRTDPDQQQRKCQTKNCHHCQKVEGQNKLKRSFTSVLFAQKLLLSQMRSGVIPTLAI